MWPPTSRSSIFHHRPSLLPAISSPSLINHSSSLFPIVLAESPVKPHPDSTTYQCLLGKLLSVFPPCIRNGIDWTRDRWTGLIVRLRSKGPTDTSSGSLVLVDTTSEMVTDKSTSGAVLLAATAPVSVVTPTAPIPVPALSSLPVKAEPCPPSSSTSSYFFSEHYHGHLFSNMDYLVKKLFSDLGIKASPSSLTDYEVVIAVNLIDTSQLPATSWQSIGGLDTTIDDIRQSVIRPFQHQDRRGSKLLRPPRGVLLYGPPGCGKTMLARAMARDAGAQFINLQVADMVNMWYGETQKYVEAVFSLAHKLQPTIIFIDEIDCFLSSRRADDHESTRMMKTQFMALWDGLLTDDWSKVLVVGATNRPGDLDYAILRRLPCKIQVPLPGPQQRVDILRICLADDPLASNLSPDQLKEIASRLDGLSGSDLAELSRQAAFIAVAGQDSRQPQLRPEHFAQAYRKFASNRVAVASNSSNSFGFLNNNSNADEEDNEPVAPPID